MIGIVGIALLKILPAFKHSKDFIEIIKYSNDACLMLTDQLSKPALNKVRYAFQFQNGSV